MMIIRVYHSYYGCDTGCCGHRFEIGDNDFGSNFSFTHWDPKKETALEYAKGLVEEHLGEAQAATLDWSTAEVEVLGYGEC